MERGCGWETCEIQDPTTPSREACGKLNSWWSAVVKVNWVVYSFSVAFLGESLIHLLFIAPSLKHCWNRFHIILQTSTKKMYCKKDSADALRLKRRQPWGMEPICWHFSDVLCYSHPLLWARWKFGAAAQLLTLVKKIKNYSGVLWDWAAGK